MALSSPKFDPDLFDDVIFDIYGDTALMHAQADIARAGATRAGYLSSRVFVEIDGVQRAYAKEDETNKVLDLVIRESNTGNPNTATFTTKGFDLDAGSAIVITLGSKNRIRRLFAGIVLTPTERNVGTPENRWTDVDAVDFTWSLNRIPVIGHFTGTYDEIALELMATYAPPGYTTTQVEAGLDTVTNGITFTNETLSSALQQLAKRGGITQRIDYRKDLYFRVTSMPHVTEPTTLRRSLSTLKKFSVSRDLSQVFNRVYFEGGGAAALTEVPIDETFLPVLDPSWYDPTGGVVLSGPQRISYTGLDLGGAGAIVGPGAAPSAPPVLARAASTGVTTGTHQVAFTHVTGAGESLPSPVGEIEVGVVPAPTSAATAGTPTSGDGLDAGDHRYYPVFRTAAGSTTAGPVSNSITAIGQTAAPDSFDAFNGGTTRADGALDMNADYGYKVTFWDGGTRETTPSVAVTFSTTNFGGTANAGAIDISTLPTPPAGFQLRFYRTEGGGATYKLLPYGQGAGQFKEISSGFYIDVKADADLGVAAPSTNTTAKGVCAVTDIPVSADALVTHVDMYREFNGAGAGTAKLAFSVANGVTSASDSTANSGLGATVPGSNTAVAGRIAVSGIAIGQSSVTSRNVYMTEAGGVQLKFVATIANNTDDDYEIATSDGSLGANAPTMDTSGLTQEAGQVSVGATSLLVTGLGSLPSAGWAVIGNGHLVIRYTGKSTTSLTGIPASGAGSIAAPIGYNSTVTAAPQLTGVTGIRYTIPKGQDVNIEVQVDDTDSQTLLASMLDDGSDGVRATTLQDRRLSLAEARARAEAYLDLHAPIEASVHYLSKDVNLGGGRLQGVHLGAPTNVIDELRVQTVTIQNFTPNLQPDRVAMASSQLFTIDELLQQAKR